MTYEEKVTSVIEKDKEFKSLLELAGGINKVVHSKQCDVYLTKSIKQELEKIRQTIFENTDKLEDELADLVGGND